MKRILVALDKSELSEVVFEEGVALAEAMGAQVLLLNVTSLFEGMSLGGDMPNLSLVLERSAELHQLGVEFLKSLAERTSEAVQEYAERAPEAVVEEVQYSHQFGEPGKTICEIAKDWDADAIAIGRRGLGAIGELLVGSVSSYVMHHAHCSVFV
ncbi:MAG: universal stress protein, partial [Cyanobacteria bacterium P01_A01_bin.3]